MLLWLVLGLELGGDGGRAPGRMTSGCDGAWCTGCGGIVVMIFCVVQSYTRNVML